MLFEGDSTRHALFLRESKMEFNHQDTQQITVLIDRIDQWKADTPGDGRRGAELRVHIDVPAAVLEHEGVHHCLADLVVDRVLEPVVITLRLKHRYQCRSYFE